MELEGLEVVLVHGTWAASDKLVEGGSFNRADYSNGSTWKRELGEGIAEATGRSNDDVFEYDWSGDNKSYIRLFAAYRLVDLLTDPNSNPMADEKHVTFVAHSHGGNVVKEAQKILLDKGWTVDIINIATPQRKDNQSSKNSNGIYLNFYYSNDMIQWMGTDDGYLFRNKDNVGPLGARKDPNADANVSVDDVYENSSSSDWWGEFGGHSYHSNIDVIKFIINTVKQQVNTVKQQNANSQPTE